MLETSKDLLYIVLAICVLWLTVFFSWGMYHIIGMLRNMNRVTNSVREKIELIDNILKLVKDKLEHGTSQMSIIADSAIKLVGFIMEKQKESSVKKTSRKKKS